MNNWCVLLAAGRGSRSGLARNKVFFKWHGRSVLSRCIDAFEASGLYQGMVLVLSENEFDDYGELIKTEGAHELVKRIVAGGDERRKSALNGLKAVPADAKIVSIHDAARPFVTADIMRATIDDARAYGSGVISTAVTDTIKELDPETETVRSLDRSRLRAVQTPQTFRYAEIMKAHLMAEETGISVTDDAMLYEKTFGNVRLSSSKDATMNTKLTLPEDFSMEEAPAMRIGHGYDAHRLAEGRELVLCGVKVPHDRGLDGHSDADVAVHALMDAILGALGEGDIGHRFPDSDDRYKGISSMLLLDNVVQFMREKGYRVANADVTIIAQKPKLAPFIEQMRMNLATAMGVQTDQANVKATTTERMGFEGEQIGISSHAVVLLVK